MSVLRGAFREGDRHVVVELVVYAAVGGLLNVVYLAMYLGCREFADPQPANAVALVGSTIVGTFAHRRFTFGVRSNARTVLHQSLGMVMLVFGLAVTAGSLLALELLVEQPSRLDELGVLAAANLGVGLARFLVFRTVMRAPRAEQPRDEQPGAE